MQMHIGADGDIKRIPICTVNVPLIKKNSVRRQTHRKWIKTSIKQCLLNECCVFFSFPLAILSFMRNISIEFLKVVQ